MYSSGHIKVEYIYKKNLDSMVFKTRQIQEWQGRGEGGGYLRIFEWIEYKIPLLSLCKCKFSYFSQNFWRSDETIGLMVMLSVKFLLFLRTQLNHLHRL